MNGIKIYLVKMIRIKTKINMNGMKLNETKIKIKINEMKMNMEMMKEKRIKRIKQKWMNKFSTNEE